MKYIKLFDTHADYTAYIGGSEKILPNISYCENENECHYNPYSDPRLIVKYNVVNDSHPTMLYTCMSQGGVTIDGVTMFDKIELDGVELSISDIDTAQGMYQLSEGEHIVKYTLKDPTLVGVEIIDMSTQQVNIGATFMQCDAISEVKIPNSVTTIDNLAFGYCGLTNITIPNSVTTIGQSAFEECNNLTNITIPNSVTTIGQSAFTNCYSFTDIIIPNSVTSIGTYAFSECDSLISITIPNSVTSIGNYVFSGCDSLASVTIGNSVTSIGEAVFGGCESLISVTIEATTPPTLGEYLLGINASDCKIYVPSASVNTYKAANGWSEYANRIQAIP